MSLTIIYICIGIIWSLIWLPLLKLVTSKNYKDETEYRQIIEHNIEHIKFKSNNFDVDSAIAQLSKSKIHIDFHI